MTSRILLPFLFIVAIVFGACQSAEAPQNIPAITVAQSATATPSPTYTALPTYTLPPTWTPVPTDTPRPTPTSTPVPMLRLPNTPRPPAKAMPPPPPLSSITADVPSHVVTNRPRVTVPEIVPPTPLPLPTLSRTTLPTIAIPTLPPVVLATTPLTLPTPMAMSSPPSTPQPRHGTPGVDCGPNCSWDFVPAVTSVEWIDPPTVSGNGNLTLKVKVGENDRMTFPNQAGGGASNIALTNGGSQLYSMVIPPAPPGMTWNPTPGQWIADTYHLRARIFTVTARIDAWTASQQDLTLCLWTGGQGSANRVLACIPVARP